MNTSLATGGGIGSIAGVIASALLAHFKVDITAGGLAAIGSTAAGVGVALGHGIDKYGLVGLFKVLLHGVPKS